jgi:ArsR family transcriptional regulator
MIATLEASTDATLDRPEELPEEFYDVAQICKMLAEPSRLRVVFFLMNESELNVGVMCRRLKQSQPAVSHHLALLKQTGLVKVRRDGKHNFYSLCRERFHQIILRLFETIADTSDEDGLRFENFLLTYAPQTTS